MNKLIPFIIFVTAFIALYGLLHFYFYRKVMKAFGMSGSSHLLLIIILCFLLISPIIINILADSDQFLLTRILAYIGYIWMGALLLFCFINLAVDIYSLIIHVSARISTAALLRYIPGNRLVLILSLLMVIGIVIYGRFESGDIRVEHIDFRTAKLPHEVGNLRVALIADIHFSPTNGLRLAQKIGRIIEEQKPDLLVSAGDLLDKGVQDKKAVTAVFRNIPVPYGKYATTGNHEFITGIKESVEFTEEAGFRMLRNENVLVGDFLNILAIDDPAGKRFGDGYQVPESKVLEGFSPDRLNLFLKHQPVIEKSSPGKFDIQLSGHTHDGQIFPFNLVVSLFYHYMSGLYNVGNGSCLYVSRGTGTWGPPIRFLAFPEITVMDFKPLDN